MNKEITCIINGVTYPVIFTMGAMLRYKRLTGKEITEMDQNSLEDAATLIYCAAASGAKSKGIDFPYELEDFYDCMSMEDFGILSQAVIAQYSQPMSKATGGKKK